MAEHTEREGVNSMEAVVIDFIKNFRKSGDVINMFMDKAYSYWFALILYWRFLSSGAHSIMYTSSGKCFATQVGDQIYDITGIVTSDRSDWVSLQTLSKAEYNNATAASMFPYFGTQHEHPGGLSAGAQPDVLCKS